ncbi:MAG: Gfo/Idh/MocA family protein [Gemmataceae bacterium]
MRHSPKLRWGILGVAKINQRLLPAFAQATNAELRAIASRSPVRAQAAAQEAGIRVAHGSYEALLDDPAIDAVYIPLPNTLHAEWTRQAAERGKHILCEKPLTPTAADAEALVAFCQAKRVKLMDGFMWPHHPRTARLRQLIDSGTIGEVRKVTGAFTFKMAPLDPANIRLRPELAGGSLLDVGCYPVFGIRWAFGGEPVSVVAQATYQHGVDVELSGLLDMGKGRVGAFDCGFTLPLRQYLEITGTEGSIWIQDMWLPLDPAVFVIHRENRPPEEVRIAGHNQIVHMLEDFGRAVLENQTIDPDPMEAVRTLRVLDALAQAAGAGQRVGVKC